MTGKFGTSFFGLPEMLTVDSRESSLSTPGSLPYILTGHFPQTLTFVLDM
ncbi:hypothetical protein AWB64_02094 [Caballeronia sordidicola]|uniref:Uncharacterized protein n=1 Tax=Caballeronia sordidicola TaxID=196367 RepID=A0A158G2A6_CABSO|nr:hypothetical protein AWB64_02094 [Caballeronia sordidicola]